LQAKSDENNERVEQNKVVGGKVPKSELECMDVKAKSD